MDYIRTVELLGNDLEVAKVDLTDVLPPATKMVISVTASTTQGEKLDDDEVERLCEACQMVTDLLDAKLKILEYVESRMAFIAPNLSLIVGASTAAKLMGAAGGLTALSKMPACNVLLLGAQKRTLSGFSSAAAMPHTGFIYYSEIVQVCL
jgi:U4/U6 small nuclear ribonucleoprotein PRP31